MSLRRNVYLPVKPRRLQHGFTTAALNSGVSLRDVQEAASHADPRTTMRYVARTSLDRHATYIAAYLAGAARQTRVERSRRPDRHLSQADFRTLIA